MKLRTTLLTAAFTLVVTNVHANEANCLNRLIEHAKAANAFVAWVQPIDIRDFPIINKLDTDLRHDPRPETVTVSLEELQQLNDDFAASLARMQELTNEHNNLVYDKCAKPDKVTDEQMAPYFAQVQTNLAIIKNVLAHKQSNQTAN
jgi:hypothetical protein